MMRSNPMRQRLSSSRLICRGRTDGSTSRLREVAFYTQVALAMPEQLVPRCFSADWNRDNSWYLLLQDLTDTHALPTKWPLPPNRQKCKAVLATPPGGTIRALQGRLAPGTLSGLHNDTRELGQRYAQFPIS
jgi:hypothetical protein